MRIYFMGVCGAAMGNAALLMRAAGHEVLGADSGVYPPMSGVLAAAGIDVHQGYDAARLAKLAPGLVVIGNAMSRGNPEVEWLLASRALPFTSLPALLHDLILARRDNIVVCGTHGKTTTAALTAFLLRENGLDPGWLIGGVPLDPPSGSHPGSPVRPFVIEGDEYDSAFFDKRSKFIHYAPRIAILNNLEFDHADIFRDLADVKRAFTHLTRIVPANGCIIYNGDDASLLEIVGQVTWCKTLAVGAGENNFARIAGFSENADGISFTLLRDGAEWETIRMPIPGFYNARNAAMAVVAATLAAAQTARPAPGRGAPGPLSSDSEAAAAEDRPAPKCKRPPDAQPLLIAAPLSRFRNVRRRQETLVSTPALTVIEDFGHHPTALAATLQSFRNRFPGATLTAVFEPRSNTARARVLQDDFAAALSRAGEVWLAAVSRAETLAPSERLDTGAIARHLVARGIRAEAFADNAALLEKLIARTLPPDARRPRVVIFFSNGSFGGIIEKYARAAAGA